MAGRYEITKFNGSNFLLWKIKSQAILRKENCLVTIGDIPEVFTDDEKWNERRSQGNMASTSGSGKILFSEATTVAEGRQKFCDTWIMDSGATWHMTSRREWFDHYEPVSGGSVFMGNDHALEIAGVGTIKIKMFDDTIRTIQEVRHVKGLTKNLLSLGQLDDIGCKTRIESGIMKIVKGALVVMKAEKVAANLYVLMGETHKEAELAVASSGYGEELTVLWHRKCNDPITVLSH